MYTHRHEASEDAYLVYSKIRQFTHTTGNRPTVHLHSVPIIFVTDPRTTKMPYPLFVPVNIFSHKFFFTEDINRRFF